jgi:hypothetical protein
MGGVSLAALSGGCTPMPGTVTEFRQAPPPYSGAMPLSSSAAAMREYLNGQK